MIERHNAIATLGAAVATVLDQLNKGELRQAAEAFADGFEFKDHGVGLDFTDRERLLEFFRKRRELYPDTVVALEATYEAGEYVTTEWNLRASMTEPFLGGALRTVPVTVQGASVVQIKDGKIRRWFDYYDGLTARRAALTSLFTDWIEL